MLRVMVRRVVSFSGDALAIAAQQHDTAAVAAKAGDVERRAAGCGVFYGRVGAAVEEQLDAGGPAALAAEEQSGVAFLVGDVRIMATF